MRSVFHFNSNLEVLLQDPMLSMPLDYSGFLELKIFDPMSLDQCTF